MGKEQPPVAWGRNVQASDLKPQNLQSLLSHQPAGMVTSSCPTLGHLPFSLKMIQRLQPFKTSRTLSGSADKLLLATRPLTRVKSNVA